MGITIKLVNIFEMIMHITLLPLLYIVYFIKLGITKFFNMMFKEAFEITIIYLTALLGTLIALVSPVFGAIIVMAVLYTLFMLDH